MEVNIIIGEVVPLVYSIFIIIAVKFDCCIGHSSRKALCREEEREALLSFKKGIDDPSNRPSSWVSDHEECCNWEGVHCHNTTGHVLKLNFRGAINGQHASPLGGEISSSLLDLKHLRYLDLSCNDFWFLNIPKFFACLSNLRYLNFSSAGFGGFIPRQLGNLSKLRYLDIGDSYYDGTNYPYYGSSICDNRNNLSVEDLEWISGLPFLRYLDMTRVYVRNASNWLKVMNKHPSLSVMRLSSCGISSIDPLLHVNLSSLLILDLSANNLISSSFEWFADLSSLTTLNLASNGIQGQIPSGIRNMTSLRYLDLSMNNFSSPVPGWLFHMTTLEHLNLAFLNFVSSTFEGKLPNDFGNLTSITYLDLSFNSLEGEVPRSLGNLCSFHLSNFSYYLPRKSLEFLSLRGNQLSGSFPDFLGECKSLEHLDMGRNRFSGNLPNKLGQLRCLSTLSIDGNSFSGNIPISLGRMSLLRYISIKENLFDGILSEKHLANLTSLEELDACSNLQLTVRVSSNWTPPFQLKRLYFESCFVGLQFPSWLQTQKNLEILDMHNAGISSVIPAWFWSGYYDTVDLSHNQIIGSIPSLNSSTLRLGSNNFTGPLPQISFAVVELDLSNNLFCGSLSPMLCGRRTDKEENQLWFLDVSGNLLSGELPNCWMYWRRLMKLNLGNNNLKGRIPSSMASLISLGSLHLRSNHLSGDIPLSLKNCSNLVVLDLSENEFTGNIPAWMGTFNRKLLPPFEDNEAVLGLTVLVLHSNKFNGSIPLELCHLDALQILDLGNNNLSGTIPRCFVNFSRMIKPSNSASPFTFYNGYYLDLRSTDTAKLVMKGVEYEYDNTLGLLAGIDLSSNELSGGIPEELTRLHGLIFLNLSHNHLEGNIPVNIEAMTSLESLDLSMNRLSGVIPQGKATISFLSHLNLSYNNLSGKIPPGTQIRGFSPLSFIGNPELSGAPLTVDCGEVSKPKAPSIPEKAETEDSEWIHMYWFYLGWGFVVGFWAILAPLAFNSALRRAYFQFLDEMKYRLLGWCL